MRDRKGYLYFLVVICALFWGFSFFATTYALGQGLKPFELLMLRWGVAAILFLGLVCIGMVKINVNKKYLKSVLIVGALQPCLYSIFETTGIGLTSTSESSILIATIPLTVLILGVAFFHKKAVPLTIFAIILAFIGVVICVAFAPGFQLGDKLYGYAVVMTAVLIAGFFSHASAGVSDQISPMELTFGMSVMGGIFFLITNLAMGNGSKSVAMVFSNSKLFVAVMFLGVCCSCICYIIFNFVLSKLPAARASNLIANSTTAVGLISGAAFAGDPFGWYTFVGLGMTLTGIWLTTRVK